MNFKTSIKLKSWLYSKLQPLQHEEGIRKAMLLKDNFNIKGDYYEFGVYKGESLYIAMHYARQLNLINNADDSMMFYGFDTFEGLPHSEGIWHTGMYHGTEEDVDDLCQGYISHYQLIKGLFSKTLPKTQPPQPIAIAHIDCDLYRSTREVLEWLTPHIKDKMILVFDDYYMNDGRSEKLAFLEWRVENPPFHIIKQESYGLNGEILVVKNNKKD